MTLKSNLTKLSAITSLFALTATGCIVDPDAFDPRPSILNGDTGVAITATWTVNGMTPSQAVCDEAGINKVRLSIISPTTDEEYSDFLNYEADCAVGTWTFENAIRQEAFRARLDGISTLSSLVASGAVTSITGVGQTTVALPAQDFVNSVNGFDPVTGGDVTLVGAWMLNGSAPTAQSCADTKVANVRVVVKNEMNEEYRGPALTFPCAQGSINIPNGIRMGSYDTKWEAVDAGGTVLASTEYLTFNIDGQMMATLATPDFEVEVVLPDDKLSVNVMWESGVGTGVFGGCNQGVSTWDYTLEGPSGTETMNGIACGTGIESSALDAGAYTMSVVGYQADGTRGWEGVCTGLNVVAGGATQTYDCEINAIIELVVNLTWESAPGVNGTCANLPIAPTFNWELFPVTANPNEPAIAMGDGQACSDSLLPTLPANIAAGQYKVGINGSAPDGTKWGTRDMCTVDLDRGVETFNCTVFLVE